MAKPPKAPLASSATAAGGQARPKATRTTADAEAANVALLKKMQGGTLDQSCTEQAAMAPSADTPPTAFTLNDEAAGLLLRISRERKLSIAHIAYVRRIFLQPTNDDPEHFFTQISEASRRVGDDAGSFDRFMLLVALNRGLTNQAAFAAALDMANKKAAPVASGFLPAIGTLLSMGLSGTGALGSAAVAAANMWRSHRATVGLDWESLRGNIALLDLLVQLYPRSDALLQQIRSRRGKTDGISVSSAGHVIHFLTERQLIAKSMNLFINTSKLNNREYRRFLIRSMTSEHDSDQFDNIDNKLIYDIISESFIDQLEALDIFGHIIESKSYIEKQEIIREILANSLQQAFDEAGLPEQERPAFIAKLTDVLIDRSQIFEGAGQPAMPPTEAPVLWKDREPGETAPDFARRIYGSWLKDGMSKRVLRRLDATLVLELNKWVREGNDMPSDIRLLTVGEENQRLLDAGPAAVQEHLGKFTGAEAAREAMRLRSAESRLK